MVVLCATIIKKQINLLPPNKQIATQEELCRRYEKTYLIHDGCDVSEAIFSIDLNHVILAKADSTQAVPRIDLDQLVAISFTSGSTGHSKPNEKTWNTFVESTRINRTYMLPESAQTINLLATVPAQHMWGLETSAIMALFIDVCVVDAMPFFPQDIHDVLHGMPSRRVMVSTPVYLCALVESGLQFPALDTVLCATSPLGRELASNVEQTFDTTLKEVW